MTFIDDLFSEPITKVDVTDALTVDDVYGEIFSKEPSHEVWINENTHCYHSVVMFAVECYNDYDVIESGLLDELLNRFSIIFDALRVPHSDAFVSIYGRKEKDSNTKCYNLITDRNLYGNGYINIDMFIDFCVPGGLTSFLRLIASVYHLGFYRSNLNEQIAIHQYIYTYDKKADSHMPCKQIGAGIEFAVHMGTKDIGSHVEDIQTLVRKITIYLFKTGSFSFTLEELEERVKKFMKITNKRWNAVGFIPESPVVNDKIYEVIRIVDF